MKDNKKAIEMIITWSEEQLSVFRDLVNEGAYEWTTAAEKVNNYDYTVIEHDGRDTEEECVGRYYAGECLDIPEFIEPYFDYESYGRDILIESESITNDDYTIIIY